MLQLQRLGESGCSNTQRCDAKYSQAVIVPYHVHYANCDYMSSLCTLIYCQ